MTQTWKPLIYRGVNYGEWYQIDEHGRIKRKAYYIKSYFGEIYHSEKIHTPKETIGIKVRSKNIRKTIDVKRAVAENFIETIGEDYLYVYRYDEDKGNHYSNLYWSNQKSVERDGASYNVLLERNVKLDRKIIKAYESGMTYDEMINLFKVSRYYIRKALDIHGIPRSQVRNRANVSVDLDVMREMFLKGATLRQVAETFGISKYASSYYKDLLGLQKKLQIVSVDT